MGTVAIEEVTGRIAENLECLKRFTRRWMYKTSIYKRG